MPLPKLLFTILMLLCFYTPGIAQQTDPADLPKDTAVAAFATTSNTLDSVTVTAFNLQSRWQDAPVAMSVITPAQLQLLNNVSLVPVLNTCTGCTNGGALAGQLPLIYTRQPVALAFWRTQCKSVLERYPAFGCRRQYLFAVGRHQPGAIAGDHQRTCEQLVWCQYRRCGYFAFGQLCHAKNK